MQTRTSSERRTSSARDPQCPRTASRWTDKVSSPRVPVVPQVNAEVSVVALTEAVAASVVHPVVASAADSEVAIGAVVVAVAEASDDRVSPTFLSVR